MSTPAQAAAQSDEASEQQDATPTFEQRVSAVIKEATADDKGNLVLPDDIPDDLQFAVRTEKRRRDTQTALANSSSSEAALAAENKALRERLKQQAAVPQLTADQQAELDELKFKDPDAWRVRVNELETEAARAADDELSSISESARIAGLTGARKTLLEAFLVDNPGLTIDDDVLQNDVPPRITQRLADGEITFSDYLNEVKKYLGTEKVIQSADPDDNPNLNELGGRDRPSQHDETAQELKDYENLVF